MRLPFSVACRPSWNLLVRLPFSLAIVTLLCLVAPGSLRAYTSERVALGSNILVDGKRVIFAQGTGSLTTLNLETGEVLLRKKPGRNFEYSGKLQRSVHGVMMMSYGRVALLDGNTFDPIWRADHCYDAVSDGEQIVSHDGNHSVHCRNVQTGKLSWKVDMEGGWHLLAGDGKVLVGTRDYRDTRPALLILDLKKGGQILRQEAGQEIRWHQVYFDGQLIYLVEGDGVERGLFPRRPSQVKALNLAGKVVDKVDYDSPEVVLSTSQENAAFIWGDKYFSDGRVQAVTAYQRETLVRLWKKGNEFREMLEDDRDFFRRRDYFPQLLSSGVFANFPSKDADHEIGQLLQKIESKISWTAYAPFLGKFGMISHVAEADGKLLLGSSEGHLECLDSETGHPRWLYTFPMIRQTVTYSSPHGMPPYLTQLAAEYRDGVEKASISCGSLPMSSDFQPGSTNWAKLRTETRYPGRIIIDPIPDDPFIELESYVTWLAVCASLPIAGGLAIALIWVARRKSPKPALPESSPAKMPASAAFVASFLVLSISPAYGLLEYGRVSHSWTIALKVIFAMTIAVAD